MAKASGLTLKKTRFFWDFYLFFGAGRFILDGWTRANRDALRARFRNFNRQFSRTDLALKMTKKMDRIVRHQGRLVRQTAVGRVALRAALRASINGFSRSAAVAGFSAIGMLSGLPAFAQEACCFEPAYRLQCETVMQPQTVQRFRIAYETDMVEEEVVSFRPVLRTRTEEREYRVARPVTETNFREERYTVQRPVIETSYRDEQFNETTYVTETAEREERVTTFRQVNETQMFQQQFLVQRPVVETQMVPQQQVVQRPVVETQFRTEQVTSMRPVTTVQNQTVDMGGFVNQQVVQPGQTTFGLTWVPRAVQTTGPFGIFSVNRGASVWTPITTPPTVQNQMVYRPNLVTQQVAQTSFVPEVQQQQVPVQVMRMQTETVTQQVPVQVTRMQSEVVSQQVPVTTSRMEPVVEVRKIPYTVQRPVTETKTRRVPIQQQRWVSEEQVRRVPVTTTRIEYETRKEPVEIKYFEQERVVQKVQRPVTRQVYVPYTETVMVPRQVVQRAPLNYYDPFSSAIVSGYSSLDGATVTPLSSEPVTSQKPAVDSKAEGAADEKQSSAKPELGPSVLDAPANADETPKTRLESVKISSPSDLKSEAAAEPAAAAKPTEPAPVAAADKPAAAADKASEEAAEPVPAEKEEKPELNLAPPSDDDELKAPVLKANPASHRIRYRPMLSRQV